MSRIFNIIILSSIIFSSLLYSQSLYNDVGHIPQADQVDWTNAGLFSSPPTTADTVFQINLMIGNDWDGKLLSALTQAKNFSGTAIIYFPKGTYRFYSQVNLLADDYNNIVFQGAGSNNTTLEFQLGTRDGICFKIEGETSVMSCL